MFANYATSSIFRKGTKTTHIQVVKNGSPQLVTVYYRDGVVDCLEDVFNALLADPEGLLSIKNDVALMVHGGRTMAILRISSNCITVNCRMGTRRTTTSELFNMVDSVAELVNGKVESYNLQVA